MIRTVIFYECDYCHADTKKERHHISLHLKFDSGIAQVTPPHFTKHISGIVHFCDPSCCANFFLVEMQKIREREQKKHLEFKRNDTIR